MALNLDRRQRLVIDTGQLSWEASPAAGVWRKKLEREEAESGLTTSVVKYRAGTAFSSHLHPGGEEIFVLAGVFEDEHGSYPEGSYFRNPPQSSHTPKSTAGCELFVKLNQFQPGDDQSLRVDTSNRAWQPGLVPGLQVMALHSFGGEHTALVKWQPGTAFQPHSHFGGEEIFVIDGVFQDEYGDYPAGTWIRSPHDSRHNPYSKDGCLILVKTGHLGQ